MSGRETRLFQKLGSYLTFDSTIFRELQEPRWIGVDLERLESKQLNNGHLDNALDLYSQFVSFITFIFCGPSGQMVILRP